MAVTIQPTPANQKPIDPNTLVTSVTRKEIDAKHQEWEDLKDQYFRTAVMYEGGILLEKNREKFLLRRPKEDADVYKHRLELMTYDNHMGTGLGWWQAEMFSSEPKIDMRPTDKDGQPISDGKIPQDASAFYTQRFLPNCDRNGNSFLDTARDIFKHLLLYRQAFVMVDNPATDPNDFQTLADQKKANALDPYLCTYAPSQVINWDLDENGNYNWLVIYQQTISTGFLKKPIAVERWYYFDRAQFRVYECEQKADERQVSNGNDNVNLVRAGYHALHAENIVPFVKIELPEGWWLANRAYFPAWEHLDTSNVLRWSLRMAGLAVPVICSDEEVNNIAVSEYQFIKLSKGSTYTWTEPEGRSWQHLASRIVVLTEEIWRAMYLVSQARSNTSTAQSQSGVSKQEDMAPSHDVLDGMGAILRTGLQNILKMVGQARGDKNISPDVTGFTFEDKLTAAELDVIETTVTLGIPSRTFEKAVDKLTARIVLKGANDDIMDRIDDEIDAAPTRAELQAQQEQAQMEARFNSVRQGITSVTRDPTLKAETD